MADDIDNVNDRLDFEQAVRESALRAAATAIPPGAPGQCRDCGEEMPRLVAGRCAPCRDGRKRR